MAERRFVDEKLISAGVTCFKTNAFYHINSLAESAAVKEYLSYIYKKMIKPC